MKHEPAIIEPKRQNYWEENKTFETAVSQKRIHLAGTSAQRKADYHSFALNSSGVCRISTDLPD